MTAMLLLLLLLISPNNVLTDSPILPKNQLLSATVEDYIEGQGQSNVGYTQPMQVRPEGLIELEGELCGGMAEWLEVHVSHVSIAKNLV